MCQLIELKLGALLETENIMPFTMPSNHLKESSKLHEEAGSDGGILRAGQEGSCPLRSEDTPGKDSANATDLPGQSNLRLCV